MASSAGLNIFDCCHFFKFGELLIILVILVYQLEYHKQKSTYLFVYRFNNNQHSVSNFFQLFFTLLARY